MKKHKLYHALLTDSKEIRFSLFTSDRDKLFLHISGCYTNIMHEGCELKFEINHRAEGKEINIYMIDNNPEEYKI